MSTLRRPVARQAHLARFFATDETLVADVVALARRDLAAGRSVAVIASAAHLAAIEGALGPGLAASRERWFALDAQATLDRLLVDGQPDRTRFRSIVGDVVDRAAASGSGVSAYGEMVGLLWEHGARTAVRRLEGLWNELIAERPGTTLLCGYPFGGAVDAAGFRMIARSHGRVDPPPAREATAA